MAEYDSTHWDEILAEFFVTSQEHVEGYHELSAKTKIFFTTAFAKWDADFYIKVDDDVHVNLGMHYLLESLKVVVHSRGVNSGLVPISS